MKPMTQSIDEEVAGDPKAANEWYPIMYNELRQLAAAQLAGEAPGHTLQPTALVNEAYTRLIGDRMYANRDHFYCCAARAMRQILVDSARRKKALKRGGEFQRLDMDDIAVLDDGTSLQVLELDEAMIQLATIDPDVARIVEVHLFSGFPMEEVKTMLKMSRTKIYRLLQYGKAWLKDYIEANFRSATQVYLYPQVTHDRRR